MFYGSNVWDPVLIISQIVSVQCLFYVSLGLLQAITLGPTLGYITVAYIFDWGTLHFSSRLGVLNWVSHVVNAIAGAAALAWLVERAKKCLDFGATCYIWHTLFVCWYSGWPQSFAWWLANGCGMLIMVLLGEWLCVRREMQDIPLSIPQRLGSGLLSRGGRKESGQVVVPMMPLATEDPDQPRPRLRAGGLSNLQRSSAAAAAAAAGGGGGGAVVASSSSFNSSTPQPQSVVGVSTAASPAQLPPAAARPGSAIQMTPLGGGAGGGVASSSSGVQASAGSSSSSSAPRKKLLMVRPASQSSMVGGAAGVAGVGQQQQQQQQQAKAQQLPTAAAAPAASVSD